MHEGLWNMRVDGERCIQCALRRVKMAKTHAYHRLAHKGR